MTEGGPADRGRGGRRGLRRPRRHVRVLAATSIGRNSIDDEGMPLRGVVHYGERLRQRVLGRPADGIRRRRRRAVQPRSRSSLDVIGHELAHGVTEDEAGLEYQGQSGALNESLSDVFGSLVKQHKLSRPPTRRTG